MKKILLAICCFWALTSSAAMDVSALLPDARMTGRGEFRYFGWLIYDATLYAPQGQYRPGQPFALTLRYHRQISRQQLADSSIEEITRLYPQKYHRERLATWRERLLQALPDVRPGDQLTGVYEPEKGCRFFNQQQLISRIDDPELARAFFDIWLSPATRDPPLRQQLLGSRTP
ncbi:MULTISPECIES: chalcone isomerase family protein [unclassified Paludibacterium]|uniref:chalcone isomerase family protein n=1 Tax=unclassified Paludibacterium TaxID=2618429 RepID=UPI001C04F286|nr:chalcone isomerase family protein [Paludibacterium sp. B53371]BEV71623.1 chalcone isomerase family protein [Paludibacterium sp. THUN1379]